MYMDYLKNVDENGVLFKCEQSQFNDTIKLALTKISFIEYYDDTSLLYRDGIVSKCMICLQCAFSEYKYVICETCVTTCSHYCSIVPLSYNMEKCVTCSHYHILGPLFMTRFCHNRRYSIGLLHMCLNLTDHELNHFIKNSHKLFHKYYHTDSILFMLSINDVNSLTCVLNHDIIMYIIKLIY